MPLRVARVNRITTSEWLLIMSSEVASPLKVERTSSARSMIMWALPKLPLARRVSTSAGCRTADGSEPERTTASRAPSEEPIGV